MADSVNMSLDEIIEQNKQKRSSRSRGRGGNVRGRGGGNVRGRGGGNVANRGVGNMRGRGRGRGRGSGRGRLNRSQSQSRPGTPGAGRARSRSRGPNRRDQSRARSRSRNRSRSQSRNRSRSQQRRSNSRARSASRSRSRLRGLTPKGRAGLEDIPQMPHLLRGGRGNRGGMHRLLRSNSNTNLQGGIHSRLGVITRRGASNLRKPLALPKRGISKRGVGLSTAHQYSAVGLRSDQILRERRHNMLLIKSQTFTRSRNSSGSPSQLTVSVANDFAKRRRNSLGSGGYLNQQSLAQLDNHFGGYNTRRGPGSVKSMGSNRSSRSNQSNASRRSTRGRGRGRGRGGRGIARNFVNHQVLNEQLQKEIAAIQGRTYGNNNSNNDAPSGVSLTLVPTTTNQTLHQRFAST